MDELKQQIQDLTQRLDKLEVEKKDLEQRIEDKIAKDITDDKFDLPIIVDRGTFARFGDTSIIGLTPIENIQQHDFIISTGRDSAALKSNSISTDLKLQNQEYTNGDTNQSFFFGYRPPLYANTGKSVSNAGSTITDASFTWVTNSLANAYINIFDSAGVFKFTRKIASNTASVITITGTWPSSVSDANYIVFMPVYLGSADYPWRRVYTGEGTGEGIRFGYGVTAGGTNGLLYMDATGDLYWRDKAGSATKLN